MLDQFERAEGAVEFFDEAADGLRTRAFREGVAFGDDCPHSIERRRDVSGCCLRGHPMVAKGVELRGQVGQADIRTAGHVRSGAQPLGRPACLATHDDDPPERGDDDDAHADEQGVGEEYLEVHDLGAGCIVRPL